MERYFTDMLYDCETPPDIENGDVSVPDTTVGNTATYSCYVGYSLVGNMHRYCTAGNGWNGSQPNCVSESPVGGSTANGGLDDGGIIAIVIGVLIGVIIIAVIIAYIIYRKKNSRSNQVNQEDEDMEKQPDDWQRDVNRNDERDERRVALNENVEIGMAPVNHIQDSKNTHKKPVSRDSGRERETSQDSIKVTRPTTRDSGRENLVDHADGQGDYHRTFDTQSPHLNVRPVHPYIIEDTRHDQRPGNRLEPISQHPHAVNTMEQERSAIQDTMVDGHRHGNVNHQPEPLSNWENDEPPVVENALHKEPKKKKKKKKKKKRRRNQDDDN